MNCLKNLKDKIFHNKIKSLFYTFIFIIFLSALLETYENENKKNRSLNEVVKVFYKLSLPPQEDVSDIIYTNRLGGVFSIGIYYRGVDGDERDYNNYRKELLKLGYIERRENDKSSFSKEERNTVIHLKNTKGDIKCIDIVGNPVKPLYGKS